MAKFIVEEIPSGGGGGCLGTIVAGIALVVILGMCAGAMSKSSAHSSGSYNGGR